MVNEINFGTHKDGRDLALEYLRRSRKPKSTQEIRQATGCVGVIRHLRRLFEDGEINRTGSDKYGYYWKAERQ